MIRRLTAAPRLAVLAAVTGYEAANLTVAYAGLAIAAGNTLAPIERQGAALEEAIRRTAPPQAGPAE